MTALGESGAAGNATAPKAAEGRTHSKTLSRLISAHNAIYAFGALNAFGAFNAISALQFRAVVIVVGEFFEIGLWGK